MSGILFVGPALGITIVPLLSSLLISVQGWRTSYLILGSVVLVGIVVAAPFLRRDPGEIGLKPYGLDKVESAGIYVQTEGISLLERIEYAKDADGKMFMDKIVLEISVPPDFPEKYHNALIKVADQCAVKKAIMNPPKFDVRTVVKTS